MRVEIGNQTLILGDALDVLPTLAAGSVDCILTDPPYGIRYRPEGGDGAFGPKRFTNADCVIGDDVPFDPAPFLKVSPQVLLWGANHFANRLPEGGRWLVWDKREGCKSDSFSDCEIAWCSNPGQDRIFQWLWKGGLRRGEPSERVHPTQKPIAVMRWCLDFVMGDFLDPFMGSGTTLVAAELLGRRGIGIEISEEYFNVAVKRVEEAVRKREADAAQLQLDGTLADLPSHTDEPATADRQAFIFAE